MGDIDSLIAHLDQEGYLNDPRLEEAMLATPRHRFVPPDLVAQAYLDQPLPVGHGQTISAPHMVAMMTTALQVERGHNILEIGTGRGYQAAILKHMVGEDGTVVTVEYVEALAKAARENLQESGLAVHVLQRDGALGAPEFAPFDGVLVTCAIPSIPDSLVAQLKDGGHFVAPLGTTECDLLACRKVDGDLQCESLGACLFVNAQGKLGQDDDLLHPAP